MKRFAAFTHFNDVSCFLHTVGVARTSQLAAGHQCLRQNVKNDKNVQYFYFRALTLRPLLPHSNMNIGGVVFPLEQQSRDDESVVYHGQYDTEGVPHTKSGDRQPVQVSIEVRCLRAVELACSQPVLHA